jgi:ABC-2 type transport system permease protein
MWRILYITRKELIQAFRDRRMVFIIFVGPLLQLLLFGYAVTTDVKNITVAVMDLDHSKAGRDLQRAIFHSGYFTDVGAVDSQSDIEGVLVHGRADMVLVIPRDFAKDLERGQTAPLQVLLDGAESNSATVGMGYLGKILATYTQDQISVRMSMLTALTGSGMRPNPVTTAETRFRYNPELKSSYYMVPGVLAMILMIVTMILTGMAITREREIGTIEQIIVTPVKPWQLIAGKMLPFATIGLIDVTLILIVGVGHFHIPVVGSLWLLYSAAIIFLFTTLGLGLYVSTLANTQQQAIFVAFLVMMPAITISGFMFPIANMPEAVQYLTYLNPLRYFLIIVRGIVLKGNDFDILAPQFGALLALGITVFTLATLRFRKMSR